MFKKFTVPQLRVLGNAVATEEATLTATINSGQFDQGTPGDAFARAAAMTTIVNQFNLVVDLRKGIDAALTEKAVAASNKRAAKLAKAAAKKPA